MSYKADIQKIKDYVVLDFTDEVKTRCMFNDLVDYMNKDREITDKTRENIYLTLDKKLQRAYINCGSYKVRIK